MAARVRPISKPAVPRLALSKTEAADALGVSVDFLEEHVLHELKVVRRGRRRLIPLSELQRWIDSNAHRTLGDL
jgi:excisionase family DNA binding protein